MNVVMLVSNDMRADARVVREAAALSGVGHRVTVLALRSAAAPDREERPGYTVLRVAEQTSVSWARPLTKVAQLRERASAMTRAAVATGAEVVHCHDTDTLSAGAAAAARLKARLVYDAHELYPDMLAEQGPAGTLAARVYWRQLESRLIPRADSVITVSPDLAEELARRYSVRPAVLLNVPALEPLVPESPLREAVCAAGGPLDDSGLLLLYQGVLIGGRGLSRLVAAVARVPGVTLAVQGFGPIEAALREQARTCGAEDQVAFLGRAAPEDLHAYACGADAGVVIYERTSLNNLLAGPNKLYAYLMAGLPVLTSDFPGLRRVVVGESTGLMFDPGDQDSIAGAIGRLRDDAPGRREMAARARAAAERRYNWQTESKVLVRLYEALGRSAAASTS